MPSVASQIALASSLIVSGTIIYAVHKFQVDEREQVNKYLTTKLTKLRLLYLKFLSINYSNTNNLFIFAASQRN